MQSVCLNFTYTYLYTSSDIRRKVLRKYKIENNNKCGKIFPVKCLSFKNQYFSFLTHLYGVAEAQMLYI